MLRVYAYSGWYASAMLMIECCFRHAVLLKGAVCKSYTPCDGYAFMLASGQLAQYRINRGHFCAVWGLCDTRWVVYGPHFQQRVHFEGQSDPPST